MASARSLSPPTQKRGSKDLMLWGCGRMPGHSRCGCVLGVSVAGDVCVQLFQFSFTSELGLERRHFFFKCFFPSVILPVSKVGCPRKPQDT